MSRGLIECVDFIAILIELFYLYSSLFDKRDIRVNLQISVVELPADKFRHFVYEFWITKTFSKQILKIGILFYKNYNNLTIRFT